MSSAYHNEALRKARIIERKTAAQSAYGGRQNGGNMYQCDNERGSASPQKMTYSDSHRGFRREEKDPVFEQDDHMEYPITHHLDKAVLSDYMGDPDDYFRKCKPVRIEQGSGYDQINLPPGPRQTCSTVHSGIYRDLKHQEKTLRDHNLVMGPMSAFKDYYDTKNYHSHKSTLSHY